MENEGGAASSSSSAEGEAEECGCCKLRGMQWRVKLGVLPHSSSIHQLRRAAADGRRKYADLRRRFLVDPHMDEGQKAAHLNMDNPLSQDPESIWGRFFRNAELERSIDKDLSRLYPEHENYFQTPACQATLRRILLVWSLTHSEHSYRQGMHELLAPLLYVLHVDIAHLSHVKHLFENLSDERFDGFSLQENNSSPRGKFEKQMNMSPVSKKVSSILEDDRRFSDYGGIEIFKCKEHMTRINNVNELDPEIRAIFSGSDAYGAEGELGVLLSTRFIEHDAYCMFDALLSGEGGPLAMADYFMNSPEYSSVSELSPVIEASTCLYNLLAVVDISLYNHLVELHVEPQFFALRWLRVLFGREFVLHDLLLVWDAIFSAPNNHSLLTKDDNFLNNSACSGRSVFISTMAVSMLLYLRPSLLASPDATTCLQKLLNFPQNVDVKKLIKNAMSLEPVAQNALSTTLTPTKMGLNLDYITMGKLTRSTSVNSPCEVPVISHSSGVQNGQSSLCSPDRLRIRLPDSYWEEKWRTSVLQEVTLEKSSKQIVMDKSGKNSAGQGGEISTTDSLTQHDLVSEPDHQTEEQISRKKIVTSLKQGQEPISSAQGSKNRSFRKATSSNLLDDQVKYADSQIESSFKLIRSNESDASGCSQEKGQWQGMQSVDQKANSCAESHRNNMEKQVSDQSMTSSQALLVNESGEKNISESDVNNVCQLGIGDQGLRNQRKDETSGSCQANHSEKSHSALKEPSGKFMPVNSLQKGGVLTFLKKQKPSAVAHPGRIRWMWNLSRIFPGPKVIAEPSKDELSKNNVDSGGSKIVFQEDKFISTTKSNSVVPDDEFKQTIVDSDCTKSKEDNHFHGGKGMVECTKDELATNNGLGDNMQLSKENVSSEEQANNELLKNSFSANTPGVDGKWSSQENIEPLDIAVSSNPSVQLVVEEDANDSSCNADDAKGTEGHYSFVVSEALGSPTKLRTALAGDKLAIDLRIMGQSMLENIQVLESSLLEHSLLKKDAAALNALKGLREISNDLLQMSYLEDESNIKEN